MTVTTTMDRPKPPREGGTRTGSHFARTLGFDEGPYRLRSVMFHQGRFTIQLAGKDLPDAVLLVEAFAEGRPFFLRANELTVSVQGSSLHPIIESTLRQRAVPRLRDTTFAALQEVLEADPTATDSAVKQAPMADGLPRSDDERVAFPDRAPDAYADFFARVEVLCQKVISMWLFNPCTLILHGDRECFGPPNLGLSMVMTINAPWDNHVRDIGRPRSAVPRFTEPNPDGLLAHVTDLRERDVILGAREKETAIFDHVFSKDPGLVVFFHACVGVVSGTDVMSVYKQHKRKHHLPVLYFRGGENQDLLNFYREILVDVRLATPAAPDATASAEIPPRINLVGYTGQITAEVLAALKAMDIEVNGVVLPAMDLGAVQRFERASLNVVMPNIDFQNFYDQLFERSRVPRTMYLPAPHGVEGTRRWLGEIARATGREDRLEASFATLMAGRETRWQTLLSRTRRHRLGFVVRAREVEQLLDPALSYGIPLLSVLTEMGFGLDVIVHASDDAAGRAAIERLETTMGAAKADFRVVHTFGDLLNQLGESRCEAVFSNFFFDWRVTAAGKSIFSLQHFESGIDGAFRTAERLLQLCRTDLFRQYGKYLRRDEHGVPARPQLF